MDQYAKNVNNIEPNVNFNIVKGHTPFEMFGFHWKIGRGWGVAHPDHICWNSPNVVAYTKDARVGFRVPKPEIRLGVGHEPATFDFGEGPQTFPWSVGYVSTMETIKYGTLKVDFILPQGQHLWPAIWMTDGKTWPPEIDIVEAWSNDVLEGKRCYRRTWKGIPIPFTNEIFPGLVMGNCPRNKTGKSYRKLFRGTCSSLLNTDGGVNTCVLDWQPDEMVIMWNGRVIARESDKEALQWFNDSEGMEIHLNNYVTNQFNPDDFAKLAGNETSCLRILDVQYIK